MKKLIEVYSTPSCHFCTLAKEFLKENGLPFTEYDVKNDLERRKEMIKRSEQMGVPVIAVDNKVVVGFDKAQLAKLVGIKL